MNVKWFYLLLYSTVLFSFNPQAVPLGCPVFTNNCVYRFSCLSHIFLWNLFIQPLTKKRYLRINISISTTFFLKQIRIKENCCNYLVLSYSVKTVLHSTLVYKLYAMNLPHFAINHEAF